MPYVMSRIDVPNVDEWRHAFETVASPRPPFGLLVRGPSAGDFLPFCRSFPSRQCIAWLLQGGALAQEVRVSLLAALTVTDFRQARGANQLLESE